MLSKKTISSKFLMVGLILLAGSQSSLAQSFYKGVDLSYVNEVEDCGVVFSDRQGVAKDVYRLFESEGSNMVRLRLWHTPSWTSYSNLEDVKKSIARAKDAGMSVLLDFHYSDFWTDPGRNWRPDAWENITDNEVLGDSLYEYTYATLKELYMEDLLPVMIQIGNETNGNILIGREGANIDDSSPGLFPIDWDRQSVLFNRALDAVSVLEHETSSEIKTIIHVANPGSATSWFESAIANELTDFDIIGLSYYPQWHDIGIRGVGDYIASLKEQFQKEVMIVEIGYPWRSSGSGDNANNVLGSDSRMPTYATFSEEVQKDFLIELTWLVKENGGSGVIYWEPAWVSSSCQTYWGTGSHYENATFFNFDYQLHEGGINFLSYDYNVKPSGLEDQSVVFRVDMTRVNTENGVFVTGDFTGDSWDFIELTNNSDDHYEVTSSIPGRSEGAFVFYTDDEWVETSRESLPEACASYWNTHRAYAIKKESEVYEFAWNSCNTQVVQNPLETVGLADPSTISVFPNPTIDLIYISSLASIISVQIFDATGKEHLPDSSSLRILDIAGLERGIYYLRITTDSQVKQIKIMKK